MEKKNNIYQSRLGKDLEKRLLQAHKDRKQSVGSIIREALYMHLPK